jgi:hypothetical protein
VIIFCTGGKKLFPHNTRIHKDPKIVERIPAKLMKGMTVIKRAKYDDDTEGETRAQINKRLIKFNKTGSNPQNRSTRRSQLAILTTFTLNCPAAWRPPHE